MFDTPLSPPVIDQATIDYYVAKGRRERSLAISAMVRAIFSAPVQAPAKAADCVT